MSESDTINQIEYPNTRSSIAREIFNAEYAPGIQFSFIHPSVRWAGFQVEPLL